MRGLIKMLVSHPRLFEEVKLDYIEDRAEFLIASYGYEMHKKNIVPSESALINELRSNDEEWAVEALKNLMKEEVHFSEDYMAPLIREEFNRRVLFSAANKSLQMLKEESASDVEAFLVEQLKKVQTGIRPTEMKEAAQKTLYDLQAIYSGEVEPIWKTGHKRHDGEIGFAKRMLVMVAAQQKQGKTRKVMDYVMRLCLRNKLISVDWHTYEMHSSDMVILAISWISGISSSVIKGRSRLPTQEEQNIIIKTKAIIDELPIRWYDQAMPVDDIRKVTDKNMTENKLVVIDNMGLVQNAKGRDEVAHDNYVASSLVQMRDNTDALIFLVHHLSKESESHWNKADGYEPHTKNLRGSNKWADSLNALILLHRVAAYEQLREQFSEEEWRDLQKRILVKVPISRDSGTLRINMYHDLACCKFDEEPVP